MELRRTDSDNEDFIALVRLLDADLAEKDGADHSFYAQFNKIDKLRNVIVCYEDAHAVACGAFKPFDAETVEIKRMFTREEARHRGIASKLLAGLENWAGELGYKRTVLETGKRQPEAISLYKNNGYSITANYGQYAGIENSVCFEKAL